MTIDLRGLVPAPVTPFNRDGSVDVDAIHRLGGWLASVEGVKGLVVLGHAGEGTFLTQDEQALRHPRVQERRQRRDPDHRRHHR